MVVYLDDILVTGRMQKEHLSTLDKVLNRIERGGMRLKREKCVFVVPKVEYLWYVLSRDGIQPTEVKVHAKTEAPKPRDLTELRAFLGLVNYYAKFMKDAVTVLAPLYSLLQKKAPWKWKSAQEQVFNKAKALLG